MRAVLLCLLLLAPQAARPCELALVLAVDISGSVDHEEYRIQMQGLAEALRDGLVSEALVRAEAALMLLQWTGSSRQHVAVPWRRIGGFSDLDALAREIETAPRHWRNFSTAIGEALTVSLDQFAAVPDCRRKVIDISGDGVSNEGTDPHGVKPRLRAAGVVVNALAIESDEDDLTAYFWENVIFGEGAFVVSANDYRDYPDRIRQKLIRETVEQLACADHC